MDYAYRTAQDRNPDCRPWHDAPLSPAELDRLADQELQHGHHATAERFAFMAAAMREVRP